MALIYRTLFRNCSYLKTVTRPVQWNLGRHIPIRVVTSGICYHNNVYPYRPLFESKQIILMPSRQCSSSSSPDKTQKPTEEKKPGLVQRFKQMYKDYWYVLLPVHMATSAIWFGSFYYTVRSGFDVLGLLQSIGISESLLDPLRESGAGYFALALALYKLVTPLRYAVTVGGTTYAIKKLTALGLLKPVPSKERLKEMIQDKKENLQHRFIESKQHYQCQMKEKRSQVMEEMKRYKTEMRNMKNKGQPKQ